MRTIRLVAAAVLTVTGLVAVSATTQSASAAAAKLDIYPAKPMAKEQVYFYGDLPTDVARTIKLQYKTKHSWKTAYSTTTGGTGAFTLLHKTTVSRTYRYYAPETKVSGTTYKKITGPSQKVTVVKQKVQAITIHQAKQCASLPPEPITVTVDFYPSRPFRATVLTTPYGSYSGEEDFDGVTQFTFTPPIGVEGTVKITPTASGHNGAAAFDAPRLTYTRSNGYCL